MDKNKKIRLRNRISLKLLIMLIIFMGVVCKEETAYSRVNTNQKYAHKNALIRQKVVSLMDKHFSSESPRDKNSFNSNIQQLVAKMSYPLNPSSRIGLIVKNKMKVGITMEF